MCGIAGAIGKLNTETLSQMANKISHRGPDYQDTYSDGHVHLAHTRLSIIDLSEKSNQPLWDVEKQACIVFNGEIYNFRELHEELVKHGCKFNSAGDAEVLLNLYLVFGTDCLSKLSGIFSFAIWDESKKELFIARDNYGVKPLYYVTTDQGFCFASEIKALLEVEHVRKELNYDCLYRTLVFLWSPGEETLIKDVKKLKPGHYAIASEKGISKSEKYWNWPEYQPKNTSIPDMTAAVDKALEDAVKEQMVADVPVGAFLSGGLDSSYIVALAKRVSSAPIKCFTIDAGLTEDNKEGFADDLPYAQKVAEQLGVSLDVLKITPDIKNLLPKMIYHLDELQADPAPINVLLICEQAKKQGVKVLLSGAGGDDLFTGYRRHVAVKFERYWSWMPKPFRKLLKFATSALPQKKPITRRLAKAFQYADKDGDERIMSYFYWLDPALAKSLFKDKSKLSAGQFDFIKEKLSKTPQLNPLEKMLTLERDYFLVDHNFNYTDKMSMATGVEVRVPFLDKRVANIAANVPSNLKQKGNIGKWILKKAAEKSLAKDIIYRPKSGFGAPLRTWLKTDLKALVDELLSEKSVNSRGVFNYEVIRNLIADDREGRADYSYPIFALLCFELWSRQFLD